MGTFVVDGTLHCDGRTYAHGSSFDPSDHPSLDEATIADLRARGTLQLAVEALPAEQVQGELDALRARVAELEAAKVEPEPEAKPAEAAAEAEESSASEAPKSGEDGEGEGGDEE